MTKLDFKVKGKGHVGLVKFLPCMKLAAEVDSSGVNHLNVATTKYVNEPYLCGNNHGGSLIEGSLMRFKLVSHGGRQLLVY